MLAGKSINDLKFSKKLHYREKNFHLFFSSKSRSSFLDSSASVEPVINDKLIVNTKTHMELSQFVFSFLKTSQALNFKSIGVRAGGAGGAAAPPVSKIFGQNAKNSGNKETINDGIEK